MGKIVFVLLFSVCILGSASSSTSTDDSQAVIISYIDSYSDIAVDEMLRTGIPASIKLAQAILESNAGRSHLATQGNNHFGIKCGKYWTGKTVMREDDDYKNGKLVQSCFRAFPTSRLSFKAHSEFLMDPKKHYRYGSLFDLGPTDYKAWAKGLKKAGYATDPNYPKRLITIIERYQLFLYDTPPMAVAQKEIIREDVKKYEERIITQSVPQITETQSRPVLKDAETEPSIAVAKAETKKSSSEGFFAGVSTSYVIHMNNDAKYINTTYGDNLENIALETGTSVSDLVCFNDKAYKDSDALPAEVMIYLEPKKNKYNGSRKTYRMSKGESLFEVSQKFGIKLSKLLKRNDWDERYQPKGGDLVYLKGKRK